MSKEKLIVRYSAAERINHWIVAVCFVLLALFLCTNLMHSSRGRAINTARHDPLRAPADGVAVPVARVTRAPAASTCRWKTT